MITDFDRAGEERLVACLLGFHGIFDVLLGGFSLRAHLLSELVPVGLGSAVFLFFCGLVFITIAIVLITNTHSPHYFFVS